MDRIIYCTFSDYSSKSSGDAVNDRKLYDSIPLKLNKSIIFPTFSSSNRINIISLVKFIKNYIKEILSTDSIIITRGSKLAIIPILLRKLLKKITIVRLGCTPLMFVEREAFLKNSEFDKKYSLKMGIIIKFEYLIEKYVLNHAEWFIVENHKARKLTTIYGGDKNKIKVFPYYVQQYFLKGKNPEYDIRTDYFKIGYTGRFKEYDLLEPVINAILLLKDRNYNIKLYLIGDGPKRKELEKIIKSKNLERDIIFKGPKSHQELSEIIEKYHCLLLPMLNKICPSTIAIKILEGVMKGKIIITTNSGNNASLFLENSDLILTEPSFESIAQKIIIVMENYDNYKEHAERLAEYHKKTRSKNKNEERMISFLNEI